MTRVALYLLLVVVATAAAVLSFSALRDLALVCGFAPQLAWLLPVTADAGAAAGSLVWLTWTPGSARTFGRNLALVLLGSSVAGNAVGHALEAFSAAPHWILVVAVSGVAPAVLGAVVHLAVLAAQEGATGLVRAQPGDEDEWTGEPDSAWESAMPVGTFDFNDFTTPAVDPPATTPKVVSDSKVTPSRQSVDAKDFDPRAAELVAGGASRRELARALDITEHQARKLLAQHNGGTR